MELFSNIAVLPNGLAERDEYMTLDFVSKSL
jgi:hypothetical protein